MRSFNAALIIVVVFLTTTNSGLSQSVVWDTVGTGTLRLAVSDHGSMGLNGIGGANMDFTSSGLDCDPAANVYLYSGGPFIIQEINSAAGIYSWSTGLYQTDASAPYSFTPDPTGPPSSHFVGPVGSDAFFSGRFLNWDSTIGMERTYYAPTSGAPHNNFVVVRTDIYPLDGNSHPNLLIGDVIDWNVPSDSDAANIGGILRDMVYLQGTDTVNSTGCQLNSNRFGSSALLGKYTNTEFNIDSCVNELEIYGTFSSDNTVNNLATGGSPNGVLDSALIWNSSRNLDGEWVFVGGEEDQRINQTFVFDYTLGAGDTLTVYTALSTIMQGNSANVADNRDAALDWYRTNLRFGCPIYSCCKGITGNIDGSSDDNYDIADLTFLIDHLFINFPPLSCPEEGNVDGSPDGRVDIADLTWLIGSMFIYFDQPLAPCGGWSNR